VLCIDVVDIAACAVLEVPRNNVNRYRYARNLAASHSYIGPQGAMVVDGVALR
jgi:hypothetical protein